MNPLARGVHGSTKSSKAYRRMANDFEDETEESPASTGRLRLVATRRKKASDSKGFNKKDAPEPPMKIELDNLHDSSWTGEFPSEFSSGGTRIRTGNDNRRSSMDMDQSVLTSGTSVISRDQSADAALAPTITKPFADMRASRDFTHASAPVPFASGTKSVLSTNTFESLDQVEKPSITSPSLHQWSRHNRMGGARKMLSEKTINTIQSTNTAGTKDTTGTLNTTGGHTTTTADSTLRSSLASLTGSSLQDLSELMNSSPGDRNQSSFSQLIMEDDEARVASSRQTENHRASSISSQSADEAPGEESEEDRMMRLAMEVSLREFEEKQQQSMGRSPEPSFSAAYERARGEVQLRNQLNTFYRQSSCHSLLTTATEEATEILVENPHRGTQRSRHASSRLGAHLETESRVSTMSSNQSIDSPNNPSVQRQIEAARANLPPEEAAAIERALLGDLASDPPAEVPAREAQEPPQPPAFLAAAAARASIINDLDEERAMIERAIRDADALESEQSMTVALQLHAAEAGRYNNVPASPLPNEGHGLLSHDPFQDWNFQNSNPAYGYGGSSLESSPEMLAFDFEADEDIAFLANTAFNAFKRTLSRESAKSATKAELDARVQGQISKAVNNNLITKCNGVVKEGKEAAVYHADEGEGSDGHDVAIKVFRRLRSFRALSERFKDATPQEQLEIWAEKEYRNLVRANRARVPVASPLMQEGNIVFMRFMGDDGWPSPQLKDLELRKGSSEWHLLYSQIMVAVRKLYVTARLVHGDLSEDNILVCPPQLVENKDEGAPLPKNGSEEMQAVLIDLAQAVDVAHPASKDMLARDIEKIRTFFSSKGIKTLGQQMAMDFVMAPDRDAMVNHSMTSSRGAAATATGTHLGVDTDADARTISLVSTGSSSRSSHGSSSHKMQPSQPDRAMSITSSTTGLSCTSSSISCSQSAGSSHNTKEKEKKKKDKKEKKKKDKKVKKDKSEKSNGKRKSSKEQQTTVTIDRDLFPSCSDAKDTTIFLEEEEDEEAREDWDAEWNEEVVAVACPASP